MWISVIILIQYSLSGSTPSFPCCLIAQFNVWKCRRSCFISLPSWKMKHPLPLANVHCDTYRVYEELQGRIVMRNTELSLTHIESSCWGEEPEKRRTKKQMEQREYHSQLHGFTWWSPSLKGQLHCNSAGPTRRSLTLLSGMVQKWSQYSGEDQSWLHRSERSTHTNGGLCVYSVFSVPLNVSLHVTLEGLTALQMNACFLLDAGGCSRGVV